MMVKSPGHQQAWYWLCTIGDMFGCSSLDFIYLGQAKSKIRIKMWIHLLSSLKKFSLLRVNEKIHRLAAMTVIIGITIYATNYFVNRRLYSYVISSSNTYRWLSARLLSLQDQWNYCSLVLRHWYLHITYFFYFPWVNLINMSMFVCERFNANSHFILPHISVDSVKHPCMGSHYFDAW